LRLSPNLLAINFGTFKTEEEGRKEGRKEGGKEGGVSERLKAKVRV